MRSKNTTLDQGGAEEDDGTFHVVGCETCGRKAGQEFDITCRSVPAVIATAKELVRKGAIFGVKNMSEEFLEKILQQNH